MTESSFQSLVIPKHYLRFDSEFHLERLRGELDSCRKDPNLENAELLSARIYLAIMALDKEAIFNAARAWHPIVVEVWLSADDARKIFLLEARRCREERRALFRQFARNTKRRTRILKDMGKDTTAAEFVSYVAADERHCGFTVDDQFESRMLAKLEARWKK